MRERRSSRSNEPPHEKGRSAKATYDVVVIGAGQAGLAIGYFLKQQGTELRDPRGRRFDRSGPARPLGSSRRPYRGHSGLPGSPSPASRRRRRPTRPSHIWSGMRRPSSCRSSWTARSGGSLNRTGRSCRRSTAKGSPPSRWLTPPADSRSRSSRQRRADRAPRPAAHTQATANPRTNQQAQCSSRRGQHQLPDRRGALDHAQRCPRRRLAADAPSATTARPRSFLVVDEEPSFQHDSRIAVGRKLRTRDTLIGSSPRKLRRQHGVELKPRVVEATGRTMRFEDGSELEVDAVIWATRYRRLLLDPPRRLPPERPPRHRRGVTDAVRPRLPWSDLAAHPGLGADRLGQERCRVHRRADRGLPKRTT